VAGVSVGAINGAIIAGNPPNSRITTLRKLWANETADGLWPHVGDPSLRVARGDIERNTVNQMSAGLALASEA
jgi:NTE family protein